MKRMTLVLMLMLGSAIFTGCKQESSTDQAKKLQEEAEKKANEIMNLKEEQVKPKDHPAH